jgi:hypothetical protein
MTKQTTTVARPNASGLQCYLPVSFVDDSTFPFDRGDELQAIAIPGTGVLLLPNKRDISPEEVSVRGV